MYPTIPWHCSRISFLYARNTTSLRVFLLSPGQVIQSIFLYQIFVVLPASTFFLNSAIPSFSWLWHISSIQWKSWMTSSSSSSQEEWSFSLWEFITWTWYALSSTPGYNSTDSTSNCFGTLDNSSAHVLSFPAKHSILQLYPLNFSTYCWIFLLVHSASNRYRSGWWSVFMVNTALLR